jgi:DNA invertase Pin-like site-specific DNA recombinase
MRKPAFHRHADPLFKKGRLRKARGRSGGRPAKLTGERAEHARNLLAAGTSVSAVARSMGVSRAAVHRAMERAEPARSRSSS